MTMVQKNDIITCITACRINKYPINVNCPPINPTSVRVIAEGKNLPPLSYTRVYTTRTSHDIYYKCIVIKSFQNIK